MAHPKTVQDASADVFAAIAHPVRRGILDRLAAGEASVQELASPYDITRSAVSQHLSILRDSGLVASEQQGRQHIYHLTPAPIVEVYDWARKFEDFWHEKLDALGRYLDTSAGDGEGRTDEA